MSYGPPGRILVFILIFWGATLYMTKYYVDIHPEMHPLCKMFLMLAAFGIGLLFPALCYKGTSINHIFEMNRADFFHFVLFWRCISVDRRL